MNRLPLDLCGLIDSGRLDRLRNPEDLLKVYDVRFGSADSFIVTRDIDDQLFSIIPLGRNAAGDFWGFRGDSQTLNNVAIFYHDDEAAEWVANSVSDLIFRQTVLFGALTRLDDPRNRWSPDSAKSQVKLISETFGDLFSDKMLVILDRIAQVEPAMSHYGTTLVSEAWVADVLSEFPLNVIERTFQWRET